MQTNTYSEEKESEKRLKAQDVFAITDSCYDPSSDLGDSSFTEDAIKDETPLGPTFDLEVLDSLSAFPNRYVRRRIHQECSQIKASR